MNVKVNELNYKFNEPIETGKKMDPTRISDEELSDLFVEKFEEKISSQYDIGDIEVSVKRDVGGDGISIEVTIYGLAGSPTSEEYRNGLSGTEVVTVSRYGKGDLSFKFTGNVIDVSATDYVIVYRAE